MMFVGLFSIITVARMKRSEIRGQEHISIPGFRCALSGLRKCLIIDLCLSHFEANRLR